MKIYTTRDKRLLFPPGSLDLGEYPGGPPLTVGDVWDVHRISPPLRTNFGEGGLDKDERMV